MTRMSDLSPAQIAQVSQERAQCSEVLDAAISFVRDHYICGPDTYFDAVFVDLVQQFMQMDRVKVAALFAEALLRAARAAE